MPCQQALRYIGGKVRARTWGPKKSKEEEARDVLNTLVLAHVPVSKGFKCELLRIDMLLVNRKCIVVHLNK